MSPRETIGVADQPYVIFGGDDPACPHESVESYVLPVIPPIDQWRCRNCRRIVQQKRRWPLRVQMPDVPTPDPSNA